MEGEIGKNLFCSPSKAIIRIQSYPTRTLGFGHLCCSKKRHSDVLWNLYASQQIQLSELFSGLFSEKSFSSVN